MKRAHKTPAEEQYIHVGAGRLKKRLSDSCSEEGNDDDLSLLILFRYELVSNRSEAVLLMQTLPSHVVFQNSLFLATNQNPLELPTHIATSRDHNWGDEPTGIVQLDGKAQTCSWRYSRPWNTWPACRTTSGGRWKSARMTRGCSVAITTTGWTKRYIKLLAHPRTRRWLSSPQEWLN